MPNQVITHVVVQGAKSGSQTRIKMNRQTVFPSHDQYQDHKGLDAEMITRNVIPKI